MAQFQLSQGDLRAYYLGVLVCLGGFLFGYDTGVVGGSITLPSYKNSFGFADSSKSTATKVASLTVGLQQCGSFVGCFLMIPLGRYIGRRLSMQLCSAIFVIGAGIQTADTHDLASFYAGRIIAGLGVGGASVLVPLYASEMSPKHLRGRVGSGYQFLFTWGIFLSSWVNYAVNKHVSPATPRQWQIPISVQIIPGALLGLGMFTVPESARWLAKQDRRDEAWKALTWIRGSDGPEVQEEMDEINATIKAEKEISRGSLRVELKSKVTLYRLGLSFAIMLAQVCTGANALAYFSPQFFALVVGDGTESLLVTGIFGAVKIVSCGLFILFLSERIGRRFAFTGGALGMAACLLCVAIVHKLLPPPGHGQVTGSGIAVVALIYLAIAIYNISWGPLGWIYIAEVLSPRTRDIGVSIALGTQWTFNIVWSVATPYMIAKIGWATFLMFAIVDVCSAIFSWFCVRETMGKSLEDMEKEFNSESATLTAQIEQDDRANGSAVSSSYDAGKA
ncbi:related to quinate transport protein [Cephalotrichum gorgonifer]|uniref:Related to quinate transport protein n=1 Tax=Cephalotrichum gorgonifer TaxID=2041049 RepID=A0AAE8N881_9PEZI|nr:related to quinate transport protein [Cephalotrichum gorgonifer]